MSLCVKVLNASVLMAMATAAATQYSLAADGNTSHEKAIERGRYLVKIAGCNDCHTPGYPEAGGNIPEKQWLTGSPLGWRGPWGTTYATNLRLYMQGVSEEQWLKTAHTTQYRPPMPWFALRDMSKQDLQAIYRFTRHLGPAGALAPAYVPPNQTPNGPFVAFPQLPK